LTHIQNGDPFSTNLTQPTGPDFSNRFAVAEKQIEL
jgi:hypothetical protein